MSRSLPRFLFTLVLITLIAHVSLASPEQRRQKCEARTFDNHCSRDTHSSFDAGHTNNLNSCRFNLQLFLGPEATSCFLSPGYANFARGSVILSKYVGNYLHRYLLSPFLHSYLK